jgi:hypothetical protein
LTPGSGIRDGRKSASGSGIRDEQPGSYFLELRNHFFGFLGVKILKFFDEDPGSGMETVRIRDPGWKKVGSWIQNKHPGSATLPRTYDIRYNIVSLPGTFDIRYKIDSLPRTYDILYKMDSPPSRTYRY